MNFDYTFAAAFQDLTGASHGHAFGAGMGLGRVHQDTLEQAVTYLEEHKLQGWEQAKEFLEKEQSRELNPYLAENSITASAIVSAMYADAYSSSYKSASGIPDDQQGPPLTPEQMAVIWGAYRTGVEGISPQKSDYGYSKENFGRNIANGTEGLPAQFQMGQNAYMSQPLFEYFARQNNGRSSGGGGGGGGAGGL